MAGPSARKTPAAPNAKTVVISPELDADFKVRDRRAIQVRFFDTQAQNPARKALASKANALLDQHNCELRTTDGTCNAIKLDYSKPINSNNLDEVHAIHDLAIGSAPGTPTAITVIFCNLKSDLGDNGETFPRPAEDPNATPAKRYILLYSNKLYTADYVTLLHELGHAAGLPHAEWGSFRSDKRYNFMGTPGDPELNGNSWPGDDAMKVYQDLKDGKLGRNTIYRDQLEKIIAAPFSVKTGDSVYPAMQW